MKKLFVLAVALAALFNARAEMKNAIPLWPDGAPGALGTSSNDIPTLTPYLCESNATGAAMVICPGGAYQHLAPHEGNDYALWLNQHGVTCFVLKYRLGSNGYRHPAMINDAARAVRWVRAHADDYKIDMKRVGNSNSTDAVERQSSRPDLGILCYAVISLGEFAHKGSRDNLLGKNPSPDLVKLLSNELQVTTNTPTCFLWTTFEDKTVPMENTMLFAEALRKNHVPFALHIYEKGGHGMGLKDKFPFANPHPWAGDCLFWLKENKFVN